MPARSIPKNYRNITGIAAHTKADGQPAYESSLERDFITLLEFSPEVTAFEVQPVTIEWLDPSGTDRSYTPDTLVRFGRSRKPLLCEIKYRSDLKKGWTTFRPKFKAAIRHARQQGWRFKIITEKEVQTPKLLNARFLLGYRNQIPDADIMQMIFEHLQELRESTPNGLIQTIHRDEWNQARLIPAIWYLVATFQVGADLDQSLNMNSPIWWNQ